MKILPPVVTTAEIKDEFKSFDTRMAERKYINQENGNFFKTATKYNFFTPYENGTEFGWHALAMIAAAPGFALATAVFVCIAIKQAVEAAYEAYTHYTDHTMGDDTANTMGDTDSETTSDEEGLGTTLAFALVFAILAPLAPVALLLGVLSRSVATALSYIPEGSESSAPSEEEALRTSL